MSNKKYTYDNGRTRKDRVNVWQLEKTCEKVGSANSNHQPSH